MTNWKQLMVAALVLATVLGLADLLLYWDRVPV